MSDVPKDETPTDEPLDALGAKGRTEYDSSSRPRARPPTALNAHVTIIGAGITGLSAAQELVERGFSVLVVEKQQTFSGPADVVLGGVAAIRPHYAFAEDFLRRRRTFLPAIPSPPLGLPVRFHHGRSALDDEPLNRPHVRELARRLAVCLVDPRVEEQDRRRLERQRRGVDLLAEAVRALGADGWNLGRLPQQTELSDLLAWSREHAPRTLRDAPDDSPGSRAARPPQQTLGEPEPTITGLAAFFKDFRHALLDQPGLRPPPKGEPPAPRQKRRSPLVRGEHPLVLEIAGRADPDRDHRRGRDNYQLSLHRAVAVREALRQELQDALLELLAERGVGEPARQARAALALEALVDLRVSGRGENRGHADSRGRRRSERPEHRTVEVRLGMLELPCEHGYRFFPAGYRHLNDTLRRIPIYDDEGRPTPETVFDKLVPSPVAAIYRAQGERELRVERRLPRSFEALRVAVGQLVRDLRFEERDLLRFQLKLFEFMTSCAARRTELDDRSWLQFLGVHGGDDRPTGRYSPRFAEALDAGIVAAVGIVGKEADAHTSGNVTTQLVIDQLHFGEDVDRTLNGPTSKAWFDHWRRYLEGQGVRFALGTLNRLTFESPDPSASRSQRRWFRPDPLEEDVHVPRLWPQFDEGFLFDPVDLRYKPYEAMLDEILAEAYGIEPELEWPPGKSKKDLPAHYTLLALDAAAARSLVSNSNLPESLAGAGDLVALRSWKELQYPTAVPNKRDKEPCKCKPRSVPLAKEPLQPFSGVQLYFRERLRFFRGYMSYPDSPWALTSVFQPEFWRDGVRVEQGFLSLLSVDLGNWRAKHRFKLPAEPAASGEDGTEHEGAAPERSAPRGVTMRWVDKSAWECTAEELAWGVWDQIRSSVPAGKELPEPAVYHVDHNVRFVSREELRGCAEDPDCQKSPNDPACKGRSKEERSVQTHEAPYLITVRGQWRRRPGEPGDYQVAETHERAALGPGGVVLAGTYMKTHTRLTTMEAANESARHAVNAILADLQRRSPANTQAGTRCELFPWEDNELDDLKFLKRVDEDLHREGLPHLAEILGLDELPDLVFPDGGSGGDPAWLLRNVVTRFLAEDREHTLSGAQLDVLRQALEAFLGRGGRP